MGAPRIRFLIRTILELLIIERYKLYTNRGGTTQGAGRRECGALVRSGRGVSVGVEKGGQDKAKERIGFGLGLLSVCCQSLV